MKHTWKIAALAAFASLSAPHVQAQQLVAAKVVASCGTVSPTPHAGSLYALTMDITGTLCSQGGGGGGGGNVNVTQWDSISVGTPTTWGTPPTGQTVIGANVAVLSAPAPAPIAVSHASTTSLGTSLSAKGSSGSLLGYNCTAITGGAAGYCVAYNNATVPATGALTGAQVLDFCFFDTTARGCSLTRVSEAVTYSSGIQILVTSAASPYTYTTGTDTAAISADFQ